MPMVRTQYLFLFLGTFLVHPITYTAIAASPPPSDYYDFCAPFPCGGIDFTFPFSDSSKFGSGPINCGLLQYQIACDTSSNSSVPKLELSGRLYRVKAFSPCTGDRVITVSDTQLVSDLGAGSCESLQNLTVGVANLSLPQSNLNLTFFKCSSGSSLPPEFLQMVVINRNCSEGGELYLAVNATDAKSNKPGQSVIAAPEGCELVALPVSDAFISRQLLNASGNSSSTGPTGSDRWELLLNALRDGFPLLWKQPDECDECLGKPGRCGYNSITGKVEYFCKDGCGPRNPNRRTLIIGIASGSSSLLLVVLALLIFRKKISVVLKKSYFTSKAHPTKERVDTENFIRTYRSTLLSGYSYKDLKKMTNGFEEKLGEGGYGNVYKGRLPDGRLVAVKVLDKSNGEGRDFINEVGTIGRIHNVNIIKLFGFCLEGPKQALVYEYMPHGSLGDLLNKKRASHSFGMDKLLEIAIGIAHGIAYLHGGCESRILHLDIKPQNVLLDQDFTPKISDFGLAKVYSRHKSAITVTGPKGTIGFIAPEIFMRNLGNPSHKSDVYSFGMVLLEMVGERTSHEAPKASTSSTDYFPDWIYDRLNKEMIDADRSDSVVDEDGLVSRKMLLIGLWCIQVNPRDRPSMAMVVEMLSGSLEALEVPPRPFLFPGPSMRIEEMHSFDDAESSGSLPLRLDHNES